MCVVKSHKNFIKEQKVQIHEIKQQQTFQEVQYMYETTIKYHFTDEDCKEGEKITEGKRKTKVIISEHGQLTKS